MEAKRAAAIDGELRLNFENVKQEAETLIRAGDREKARSILLRLKGTAVPRQRSAELATLCRRAGLHALALQIMLPIIRPKVTLDIPATDEEKSVYAVILLGLGAPAEAQEILEGASNDNPDVLLSLAFTHINRWDYHSAIPILKKYLKTVGLSPYAITVAKVNLAASYVATFNPREGKPLLQEILSITSENGWALLRKNAFELSSQFAIQEKNWAEAERLLHSASEGSEAGFNLDDFFVQKWQAISLILRDGATQEAVEKIQQLRLAAQKINHWETIRDCDHHLAIAQKDEALALKVYFGTPHARFRERLLSSTKDWLSVPEHYTWRMTESASAPRVFDIRDGQEVDGQASLKVGKNLHSALKALISDFYRPFLIGSLHSAVFPGEFFNPDTGPKRISFLVHRMRSWFEENSIPLDINVSRDGYRLIAEGDYAFRIYSELSEKTDSGTAHYVVMLSKLRTVFGLEKFSAVKVADALDISERSARYFVKWALENRKMTRIGTGRATLYKLSR